MQYLRHIYISIFFLAVVSFPVSTQAVILEKINDDKTTLEVEQQIAKVTDHINDDKNLPIALKNNDDGDKLSKANSTSYLITHPKEFEQLLSILLLQANAEKLEELLPIYKQVSNYDPSVIEWGNAIILAKKGKLNKAVVAFRKLNARLPNVAVLRFQMAMALFYNGQYQAAKSEFEKLRSTTNDKAITSSINQYLDAINAKNDWDFSASVSYLNDKNITNAPKKGTKLIGKNGSETTYSSERKAGEGFNFSVSADKKWLFDNHSFISLDLNNYGDYYWDNKKFNDITSGVSIGAGYQNAMTTFEIAPFYKKRWFAGGGSSTDEKLADYSTSTGVNLNFNQWLSPKLMYQGYAQFADVKLDDAYVTGDSKTNLFANTLLYFPNAKRHWAVGLNYLDKNAEQSTNSFKRKSVRIGWSENWAKGFATKFNFGYAQRNYDKPDFFAIKRKNDEYSIDGSIWNRGYSIFGLTPRLNLSYSKVNSNSPFEEYDKNNVSIEFTKNF